MYSIDMNTKPMEKQTPRLIRQADKVIETIIDVIEEQEPQDDSELVAMYYMNICEFTARLNDRASNAMGKYLRDKARDG